MRQNIWVHCLKGKKRSITGRNRKKTLERWLGFWGHQTAVSIRMLTGRICVCGGACQDKSVSFLTENCNYNNTFGSCVNTGLRQNYTTKATQSSRQPVAALWFLHTWEGEERNGGNGLAFKWHLSSALTPLQSSCVTLCHTHLFVSTGNKHTQRCRLFKLTDTYSLRTPFMLRIGAICVNPVLFKTRVLAINRAADLKRCFPLRLLCHSSIISHSRTSALYLPQACGQY